MADTTLDPRFDDRGYCTRCGGYGEHFDGSACQLRRSVALALHPTSGCGCGSRIGCETHGPQPREHAVLCRFCWRATWALDAVCDPCTLTLEQMEANFNARGVFDGEPA